MAIKNLSLQTIALHIGYKDYSKIEEISTIYNKAGYLTNPGISILEMRLQVRKQQLQSIHQIQNQNNLIFLLCM